jgi:L-ribulose-5-phosphate 4-epimerase
MLEALREEVLAANLEVVRRGLVLYTWGNASGIDRDSSLVVIKPSGVPYSDLRAEHLVIVDLNGKLVEGSLRPSSDLPTHLVLYRAFEGIGGIVHTHSRAATAWAQAGREIPCFGTTHADYFFGPVPVTEPLTEEEVTGNYEENTGHAIVRRFERISPSDMPAVLVFGHAPFTWGTGAIDAARNAVILEEVAELSWRTLALSPECAALHDCVLNKHFKRKHGPDAYYGQR